MLIVRRGQLAYLANVNVRAVVNANVILVHTSDDVSVTMLDEIDRQTECLLHETRGPVLRQKDERSQDKLTDSFFFSSSFPKNNANIVSDEFTSFVNTESSPWGLGASNSRADSTRARQLHSKTTSTSVTHTTE